jgi:predicted nucleic acid-binding protein
MAIGVVALSGSDALHLALATEIGARTVFTTDRRLSEAARSISLAIRP